MFRMQLINLEIHFFEESPLQKEQLYFVCALKWRKLLNVKRWIRGLCIGERIIMKYLLEK
jgi:hypothetical protein